MFQKQIFRSKSVQNLDFKKPTINQNQQLKRIRKIQLRTIQIVTKYFDKVTRQKNSLAYQQQFNKKKSQQNKQNYQQKKILNNQQNNILMNSKQYYYGSITNGLKQRRYSLGLDQLLAQQINKFRLKINHNKQQKLISKIIKKINKTKDKQNQINQQFKKLQKQKTNELKCLIQDGNLKQWNLGFDLNNYSQFRRNKSQIKGERVGNDCNLFLRKNKINYDLQKKRILQRIQKLGLFPQISQKQSLKIQGHQNNDKILINNQRIYSNNKQKNQELSNQYQIKSKIILQSFKNQKHNLRKPFLFSIKKINITKQLYQQNLQKNRSSSDGWCMKHANLQHFYSQFQKINKQTFQGCSVKQKELIKLSKVTNKPQNLKLVQSPQNQLNNKNILQNFENNNKNNHNRNRSKRMSQTVRENIFSIGFFKQNTRTKTQQDNQKRQSVISQKNKFPSRFVIKRKSNIINQKNRNKKLRL